MKQSQSPFTRNLLNTLIACAAIFLAVAQAQAASVTYIFPLTANQEVPPSGSSGTGNCNVSLDDSSGAVSVSCAFSGLSGVATASHIHGPATTDQNAGVILALTPTLATSGSITGNGVLDATQMAAMMNGLTYVNLHSQATPGGEIRGQVVGQVTGATSSSIPTLSNTVMALLVILLLVAGGFVIRRRIV